VEIVVNNHVLGMVHQWQDLFYEGRYSATELFDKVDFTKVSEGLGVPARKITTPEEFKEGLKWAMNLGGPAVLECVVDPSEKVWPMVAPGASLMETFSEEDLENK
jgi:acetolactate synthase-1/2/3 large subunit